MTTTTTLSVSDIKPLTDTISQVFLATTQPRFDYLAGQYVELGLADGTKMPYSIANAPLGSPSIEFHIRHTADNAFTVALLAQLQRQGALTMSGPFGDANSAHWQAGKPTILIAGGTGFAPLKALIEQSLHRSEHTPMHLYWGARSASDLYLSDMAQQWAAHVPAFQFTAVIADPQQAGQIDVRQCLLHEAIRADYHDLSQHQVFAAGPNEMVLSTFSACVDAELDRDAYFSDTFAFIPKP